MSVTADQHFAIVPEWVLYADVSATAVRLYATLRRYADKEGKAHPSRATLAEKIRVKSVRTVDAALEELEAIGAVTTQKRKEGRQFLSSEYHVLSALPSAISRTTPSAADDTPLVQQAAHELEPLNETRTTPSAPRKQDALFDAIRMVCFDNQKLTRAELARIGVASADIRTAFDPDSYDTAVAEVERRARNYIVRWPNAALTPTALSNNWSSIGESPSAVSDDPLDFYEAPAVDEEQLAEFAAAAKANPWGGEAARASA